MKLRKILQIFTTQKKPIVQPVVDLSELSFEVMKFEYEKRTWQYRSLKNELITSNPRLLHWIGSIDYSGYIREQCLCALIADFVPGDENRILLRLSDWVTKIREIATDWTLNNFQTLPFSAIYENQNLILYLSRKEILQDERVWGMIMETLQKQVCTVEKNNFYQLDPLFRRLLLTHSLTNNLPLRKWVLYDREPFNRLLLLKYVDFDQLTLDEQQKLDHDSSIIVRRKFLYTQLDHGIQFTQEKLIALSLEKPRSLRSFGQFYLEKFYGIDAYSIYKKLDGNSFFFISDYAKPADLEIFIQGIDSENRIIQRNCLRAIAQIDPERLLRLNLEPLMQSNAKNRRIIINCIIRLSDINEAVKWKKIIETSSKNGVISFLSLLEQISFWHFIDAGFDYLLNNPSPDIVKFIHQKIRIKTSYYEPLPDVFRKRIQLKLDQLIQKNSNISSQDLELIEFALKKT